MYTSIENLYDVVLTKCDKSKLKVTFLKMKTHRKRAHSKREAVDWEMIISNGSDEIEVIKIVIPEVDIVSDEKASLEDSFKSELIQGYKPFKSVDRKQQLRRISPLIKMFKVTAKHFDILKMSYLNC